MDSLEDISFPHNEVWVHHEEHGWVVFDELDLRNCGHGALVIIRCTDWLEFEIPRGALRPPAYTPFRMHINALAGTKGQQELARLVAFQAQYETRRGAIRARGRELTRKKAEEAAEELELRRRHERDMECQRTTRELTSRAAAMSIYAALLQRSSDTELTYEELLNSAEWHQRRAQILDRDGYQCQHCACDGVGADSRILQIHHRYYVLNWLPWAYPDDALVTLCKDCHTAVHQAGKVLVYEAIGGKLARRNLTPCIRCLGAGFFPQWEHIEAGICFRCRGARFDVEFVEKADQP